MWLYLTSNLICRYNDQVPIRPQVVPTSHVTHMTAILWRTLRQLSSNYSWQPRHLGPIIPQPTSRSLNAQGPGIVMVFNCALLSFRTVKIGHNVFIVLASIKILFFSTNFPWKPCSTVPFPNFLFKKVANFLVSLSLSLVSPWKSTNSSTETDTLEVLGFGLPSENESGVPVLVLSFCWSAGLFLSTLLRHFNSYLFIS